MEESYHGLYKDHTSAYGVGVYFNQTAASGVAYLSDVKFRKFAEGCFVELHGCKAAEAHTSMWDNFALELLQKLAHGNTVVGHVTRSNPNSKGGYRHGLVRVYRDGKQEKEGDRVHLVFSNSSTPNIG